MLNRLQARLAAIVDAAAKAKRDQILTRIQPQRGVQISAADGGILLSGRLLRRRLITDSNLRNLTR